MIKNQELKALEMRFPKLEGEIIRFSPDNVAYGSGEVIISSAPGFPGYVRLTVSGESKLDSSDSGSGDATAYIKKHDLATLSRMLMGIADGLS